MSRRLRLALAAFALGLSGPLVPRVVEALRRDDGGERLGAWSRTTASRLCHDTAEVLGNWAWVLAPTLVLALLAFVLPVDRVPASPSRRRIRGFAVATFGTALIAWLICRPASGMGFEFDVGERIYPLVAIPLIPVLWWLGARNVARPPRTRRTERGGAEPTA